MMLPKVPWQKLAAAAALTALVAVGGLLQAQPLESDPNADSTPDITLDMDKEAKLDPKEMLRETDAMINEMQGMLERVVALQQVARKQKDVIRLNCVNDRLIQVKKLLNIAEASRTDMVEAIAAENERERYHQYTKVRITYENVSVLRNEAEGCVGEELIFLGPTTVEVEKPPIVDDPTKEDPFTLAGERVERPAYASPYL